MEQKSTFLKVMAIICLVFGIIAAVIGALFFAMPGMLGMLLGNTGEMLQAGIEESAFSSPEAAEALIEYGEYAGEVTASVISIALIAMAVVMVILAIIMILSGVFGLKASGNVAKIKQHTKKYRYYNGKK